MKATKMIAAAAVFALAGSAFAQGNSEYVDFSNFVSTKTRAEVKADLAQAYAQGQLAGNNEYVEFTKVASFAPRSLVRASVTAAQGAVGSSPEYVEFANVASTRTRAEVRNEVLQAAKNSREVTGS